MKFGVFDHIDANGLPLAELYENRLKLIEAYERIGIHAYHLAEHHATPLGMSPSPGVFLAAVAQRTRTLLFGPMVYTLALYHPLRLAEEICMLDHLSGGRLQLGLGRGISPIELDMFGVDPANGPARYLEAYAIIMKALTSTTLSHEGEFFSFRDVPIQLHPLQKPHPPIWMGCAQPAATVWAAQNRVNVVTLQNPQVAGAITTRYREEWAKAFGPAEPLPYVGMARHTVIGHTDEEALATARRAYRLWHKSFWHLWINHNKFGVAPPNAAYPPEFDEMLARGQALAGSPQTVAAALAGQAATGGVNYVMLDFAFGDITLDESLRSVELFAKQVMPEFSAA
ncbi:MAG: LLM class flavin-dependent oxidoreductase [Betaproteobacteria bacterium]|nr:LLM class flavin-dependent oxidoreductase [Betaproteobacteria bacterium]